MYFILIINSFLAISIKLSFMIYFNRHFHFCEFQRQDTKVTSYCYFKLKFSMYTSLCSMLGMSLAEGRSPPKEGYSERCGYAWNPGYFHWLAIKAPDPCQHAFLCVLNKLKSTATVTMTDSVDLLLHERV